MMSLAQMKSAARMLMRGRWAHLRYRMFIHRHGLDLATMTLAELGLTPELSVLHSPSGGPDLERVFRSLDIRSTDRVIDLGCGKGAAIITLSRLGFGKIAGVEISPKLIATAEENLRRAGVKDVELICSDAMSFDGYDEYNFVYMFNPFRAPVMKCVIEKLVGSLERNPRPLSIVYWYPTHEDVVLAGPFRKVREFTHAHPPIAVYAATGVEAPR
jgi:SAM-dependent methyltransferase